MGLLSGTASFTRFMVEGEVPEDFGILLPGGWQSTLFRISTIPLMSTPLVGSRSQTCLIVILLSVPMLPEIM